MHFLSSRNFCKKFREKLPANSTPVAPIFKNRGPRPTVDWHPASRKIRNFSKNLKNFEFLKFEIFSEKLPQKNWAAIPRRISKPSKRPQNFAYIVDHLMTIFDQKWPILARSSQKPGPKFPFWKLSAHYVIKMKFPKLEISNPGQTENRPIFENRARFWPKIERLVGPKSDHCCGHSHHNSDYC